MAMVAAYLPSEGISTGAGPGGETGLRIWFLAAAAALVLPPQIIGLAAVGLWAVSPPH